MCTSTSTITSIDCKMTMRSEQLPKELCPIIQGHIIKIILSMECGMKKMERAILI